MFCIHCGKQLPDTAAFCKYCGKSTADPVETQPAPEVPQPAPVYVQPAPVYIPSGPIYSQSTPVSTQPAPAPFPQQEYPYSSVPVAPPAQQSDKYAVARVILGIALILCGIFPYVFHTRVVSVISAVLSKAYSYGTLHIAAVSALNAFFGLLEPLAQFPAAMTAIAAGIALLQKRQGGKTLAIVSGIFSVLSGMVFGLALLVLAQPHLILSLFLGEVSPEVYAVLDQFGLLADIRSATLHSVILAVVTAGISFGSLFFARGHSASNLLKTDRSLSALPIMLPGLVLYRILSNLLPTLLTGTLMGSHATSALSYANSLLSRQASGLFLLVFFIVFILSVILRKPPFGLSALVAGGGVLLCAGVSSLLTPDLRMLGLPEELLEMTQEMYQFSFWGSTLMLTAVCVWMVAVTRNAIPLWLQWVLSCVIVPAYILAEVSGLAIVRLGTPGVGQIVCAIVILGAAVTTGLLRTGRKHA